MVVVQSTESFIEQPFLRTFFLNNITKLLLLQYSAFRYSDYDFDNVSYQGSLSEEEDSLCEEEQLNKGYICAPIILYVQ